MTSASRNRCRLHDVGRLKLQVAELAIFRSPVIRLLLFVPFGKHVLGRRLDGLYVRRGNEDVANIARLLAVFAHGVNERLRCLEAVGDGIHDLASDGGFRLALDVVFLAKAGVAQGRGEDVAIELAAWRAEGRFLGDLLGKARFGEPELHLVGELVKRRTCCQLREDLVLDAESTGLFRRQPRAELAGDEGNLPLIGQAELAHVDFLVADLDDGGRRAADQRARNTPNPE